MGAYVPITLGGKRFEVAELPRRANRRWQSLLTEGIRDRLKALGPLDTADAVIDAIADAADLQMDLLIAYDQFGAAAWSEVRTSPLDAVLPDRDWLDTHATDRECYEAIKLVTVASFPSMPDLVRIVPEFVPMLMRSVQQGVAVAAVALSRSTSSAPPNTGGSRTKSKTA